MTAFIDTSIFRFSHCKSAVRLVGLVLAAFFALSALSPSANAAPAPALTSGLDFSSSPGRVTLDPDFSLAGRSFTVEAWIWREGAGVDRPVLAQIGEEDLFHLIIRNDRLQLGFWNDDLTGASVLPTQQWLHIAYSYDATTRTQRVFVDGVLDGERVADAPFAENNRPLHIGGYLGASFNPFDGRMLELRIWDHARDAATLAAERFSTPPVDAPGLDALFTFEGITGANVPEATGQLTGNQIHGAVAVVEPVLPPELLPVEAAIGLTVPAGSLASAVQGYTSSPAPAVAYPDAGGAQLSDGVLPYRVWGSPWFDFSGAWTQPVMAWENASPELTFTFTERVRIDAVTLHAANSGGAEGVALPETVQIASPGGYAASFPVVAGDDIGGMQAIELDSLGIFTDSITITLDGASDWLALGEVAFEGSVLADPALQADGDWISLPAKRFLGLDPDAVDASAIHLEVVFEEGATRFEFPRATDDYGMQAVVEWSADLVEWTPLPYASAAEAGRAVAHLTPPPAEGRAFFRLVFPDGPPTVAGPGSFGAAESDSPLEFALSNRLGVDSPLDPASLELMAINDRALSALGEATPTANGGTLQFLSDGTVRYTTAPGLADGQVAEETFTYTVADRFGRTVRNQFILSVTGENDAPTAGNISATHSAGVVPAGITYQYFEGDFSSEAAFDTATPVSSGRMPSFSLDPATATSGYGLEMTGQLFVPAAGTYTFYLSGNNASVLDIGETRVVAYDPADPLAERSGTIELAAGSHSIRVRYFDVVEPAAELSVDYSGPGFIRESIPAAAFPRLESLVLDPLASASDPDDGDVLRVSQIDGQLLEAGTPVRLASGAEVQLNGDGTLTYLPAPGRTLLHEATDSDTFSFTVSDAGGLAASATAQLQLARQNSAPVADDLTINHSVETEPAGVNYRYFEGDFESEAAFDAATALSTGRIPTFSLDPASASTGYGLEMVGELFVPASGPYTFFLSGNNASVLDIGETRVVDHDPATPVAERSGTIELTPGSHRIRVRYFDVVEVDAELSVDYVGPGFLREPIPAEAMPRLEPLVLEARSLASDADLDDVLRISHIEGQPLTSSRTLLASGAELALNSDGTITYRPIPGRNLLHEASETDSFTFTVTDSSGSAGTATVDLDLARLNTAPSAVDFVFGLNSEQNGAIELADFVTDPDGHALRITHIDGVPLIDQATQTLPSLASLRFDPNQPGRILYDGGGAFVRTSAADTATDAVTLTVVDAAGATASAVASLTVDLASDPANNLLYEDARFAPEHFDVPWQYAVSFGNARPKPIPENEGDPIELSPDTAEIFARHKATGRETSRRAISILPGEKTIHTFEPLADLPLGDSDFFDAYDVNLLHVVSPIQRVRAAPEFYDQPIPPEIRLSNPYRHTVDVIVYASLKATGQETTRQSYTLAPGATVHHTFTPVVAAAPGESHFFEQHDVHVETPAGDFVHYASRPTIVPLHQTMRSHYFVGMAVNPQRNYSLQVDHGFVDYSSGRQEITRSLPDRSVRLRLDGIERLAVAPATLSLDPTFRSNINIVPVCRRPDEGADQSAYENQNLNSEPITVSLVPANTERTLPPGRSRTVIDYIGTMNAELKTLSNDAPYFLSSLTPITSECDFVDRVTVEPYAYVASLERLFVKVTNNSNMLLENGYLRIRTSATRTSGIKNLDPLGEEDFEIDLSGLPGQPLSDGFFFHYTHGGTTYEVPFEADDVPTF